MNTSESLAETHRRIRNRNAVTGGEKTLSGFSDDQLLCGVRSASKKEHLSTQEVLDFLAEIERRGSYLKWGYETLFKFVTHDLKYPAGSAGRRISAMRLLQKIPEARKTLDEHSTNLSTLCQLGTFINAEEKRIARPMDDAQKSILLKAIEGKSQEEVAKTFSEISPQVVKRLESRRPVGNGLIQVKFHASENLVKKLERLKSLVAHRSVRKSGSAATTLAELIEVLVNEGLKKFDPMTAKAVSRPSVRTAKSGVKGRTISASVKREVWRRCRGECQYQSSETGKKCGSTWALQIDHKDPFSRGGSGDVQNLQLLCRNHNLWKGAKRI